MEKPELYHVCFAVPDLKAAMTELTELLGYSWGTPLSSTLGQWGYELVFSREQPHIELVSGEHGSPWFVEQPRFHHVGFWSNDLDKDVDHWMEKEAEVTFDGRTMGRRFAYLEAKNSGLRFEGVSTQQKQVFEELWARNPE